MDQFEKVFRLALERCGDLQTWPGHFLVKKTETEVLVGSFGIHPHERGLDVGCGNAFQSALLAEFPRRLVAMDLYRPDFSNTHSVGMHRAKRLLECMEVRNVDLVASSVVDLPFRAESFDYVFSSNALEHIAERERALNEIYRVLKRGGRFLVVVPTHIASLCAFLHSPLYVVVRAVQIVVKKLSGRERDRGGTTSSGAAVWGMGRDAERSVGSLLQAFRRNHPSFPLPEPHGAYPSVFQECRSQTPWRWTRLLSGSKFVVEDSRAVVLIPISLIETVSSELMARIYSRLGKAHMALGGWAVSKAVGFTWAAVCRKT